MKPFSIVKFFTVVCFSLVTLNSGAAEKSKETCQRELEQSCKTRHLISENPTDAEKKEFRSCLEKIDCSKYKSESEQETNRQDREDEKEIINECKRSYEAWEKELGDLNAACGAVLGGPSSSDIFSTDRNKACSARIESCRQMMSNMSSANANSYTNIIGGLSALQKGQDTLDTLNMMAQNSLDAKVAGQDGTCIKDFKSQARKDAKRDYQQKKKDLEKEKKDLEDDILKEKKEQTKKQSEIQKQITDLEKALKQKNLDIDKDMREKITQASKATLESAKRIRQINQAITKENDTIKKVQFAYANAMLSQSNEKIAFACKVTLNRAKECIVKSAKKIKDDGCNADPNMAALYSMASTRGAKANAELVEKMKFINEKCYEDANLRKKEMAFQNQNTLSDASEKIKELQKQLEDENKQQQIASEENKKIQEEAQREKNEAAQNLSQETQNLNKELMNFINDSNTTMAKNSERIAEILRKLEEAEFEYKTGEESAVTEALGIVRKSNQLAEAVVADCGCDVSDKKVKQLTDVSKSKARTGSISSVQTKRKKLSTDAICTKFIKNDPASKDPKNSTSGRGTN